MVWYSHLFQNFPQFAVIHTDKGFNESESHSIVYNSLRHHGLVYGILQARILEWVAFPFSRDLLNSGIEPRSPTLQVDSLPAEPQVLVILKVLIQIQADLDIGKSKYNLKIIRLAYNYFLNIHILYF